MIYRLFLFLNFLYVSINASRPRFSSRISPVPEVASNSIKFKDNATAELDLAVKLIQNVRDSYPVSSVSSKSQPIDCEEVLSNGFNKSGVYKVFPRSRVIQSPIEVYCDMVTDGGGWTLIQRRGNFGRPKDSFFQDWETYKKGFGNVRNEFWLGNDNIFGLSNQRLYSVRFDLQDVGGYRRFAKYDTFWIDDEDHKYTLHIHGYSGTAGDSMINAHNGQKFSTKDQQNDNLQQEGTSCAQEYKGGWWYNMCHEANLNGLNLRGKHDSFSDGVNWYSWKGFNESIKRTEIKIRSKGFRR